MERRREKKQTTGCFTVQAKKEPVRPERACEKGKKLFKVYLLSITNLIGSCHRNLSETRHMLRVIAVTEDIAETGYPSVHQVHGFPRLWLFI